VTATEDSTENLELGEEGSYSAEDSNGTRTVHVYTRSDIHQPLHTDKMKSDEQGSLLAMKQTGAQESQRNRHMNLNMLPKLDIIQYNASI
jgi:hypothetical protein